MKKRVCAILCACCLALTACGGETTDTTKQETETSDAGPETGVNLIPNGDFSESSTKWGLYQESGGSATNEISNGQMVVDIASAGKKGHSVQLNCSGFEMLQGAKYTFSFDVSCDVERIIEWRIQLDGGDYHAYIMQNDIKVGPETTTITCDFDMTEASDPSPKLCFNLGDQDEAQGLGKHKVTFDNVSLMINDASSAQNVDISVDEREINLNQIGYRPEDTKIAVFRDWQKDDSFEVVSKASNEVVYSGKIVEGNTAGSTGEKVGYADFSELKEEGTYFVRSKNCGESYSFEIAKNVYDSIYTDVVKMLYLQRCGMELTTEFAGDFAHPKCHTEMATIYGTNQQIEVSGGWHDAGDYGRYTVPAAKTIADLLNAYERNPGKFTDNIGIPESGNGVADVLDEARYELEWLLKMQASDGGVYHKVTGALFDGFVSPEDCTEPLIVMPTSKTATLDFAATMYMAARVYKSIDGTFASKCLKAAEKAMPYYAKHINDRNYVNPDDISTGEYPDSKSIDEYLWALCEGYKTTLDDKFAKEIKAFDYTEFEKEDGLHGMGWQTMTEYAFYAYLTSAKSVSGMQFDINKSFFMIVDKAKNDALKEAYGSSILGTYPWGSNMTIANNGMLFEMAYSMTGDETYRLASKKQLDYLLGCNTTSYCYVTGWGGLCPEHPHHRPSQALGKTMSGMLVGGPNSNLEDSFAKSVLANQKKAHCYVDNEQSFSCNEITIYWNSPLIYLMSVYTTN